MRQTVFFSIRHGATLTSKFHQRTPPSLYFVYMYVQCSRTSPVYIYMLRPFSKATVFGHPDSWEHASKLASLFLVFRWLFCGR